MLTFSTINITGPDAFEFLQGQLTNDLRRLGDTDEILAAWCNPKGRVIWCGPVRAIDGGFSLSAPADIADDLIRRLTMFRFRSKVDFERVDDGPGVDPADLIEQGLPYVGREQSEQFTPHMLNLDLLDAISLDKGCYTGQEVVARTHYKGATKRRTVRFSSTATLSAGDKVQRDGRDVGEVLNVAGTELLAVVPIGDAGAEFSAGDATLTRRPLAGIELPG
jgi:folate-binding protein YgfZ